MKNRYFFMMLFMLCFLCSQGQNRKDIYSTLSKDKIKYTKVDIVDTKYFDSLRVIVYREKIPSMSYLCDLAKSKQKKVFTSNIAVTKDIIDQFEDYVFYIREQIYYPLCKKTILTYQDSLKNRKEVENYYRIRIQYTKTTKPETYLYYDKNMVKIPYDTLLDIKEIKLPY